jgi:hypothetical protein
MSTPNYQEAVEALLTFREILHVGTFTEPDCDTIASAYKVLWEGGLDEWSEAVSVAVSHRDVDSEASLTAYWCYKADQAIEALQAVIEGASYDVLDGVHLAHWKPNARAIVKSEGSLAYPQLTQNPWVEQPSKVIVASLT